VLVRQPFRRRNGGSFFPRPDRVKHCTGFGKSGIGPSRKSECSTVKKLGVGRRSEVFNQQA
jgi:hypothetical protein